MKRVRRFDDRRCQAANMNRWLDRVLPTLSSRLLLIAPSHESLTTFPRAIVDAEARSKQMLSMQQLREEIYRSSGYVAHQAMARDGAPSQPPDDASWHVLTLDSSGQITGCAFYRVHSHPTFDRLRLAARLCWQGEHREVRLKVAVAALIAKAQDSGMPFVEFGGWAIREDRRHTADCLMLLLAVAALDRLLGSSIGVAGVNVEHAGVEILRRFGTPLTHSGTPLPVYFDSRHQANVQVLAFDSRQLGSYDAAICLIADRLVDVAVLASDATGLDA